MNISEGRDESVVNALRAAAGRCLLDTHSDPHHHRTVLTLAGPEVAEAAEAVTRLAAELIHIGEHRGVHPRLGVVDVVPFVPLAGSTMSDAIAARDRFAVSIAEALEVPCFLYGPERSLPEIRRSAFENLEPDFGPPAPHASLGSICVGARPVLVAYNLWLRDTDLAAARRIASAIRGPHLRTLGLDVGGRAQVSCNLVEPNALGPAEAFDRVKALTPVERAELVGLIPREVLRSIAPARWSELDLSESRTIEARLDRAGH
jgi:glutamate formiminotransferase